MLTIATFLLVVPCAIQEDPPSRNRRGQETRNQEPDPISPEDYRRHLGAGIESGRITREEAARLWKEFEGKGTKTRQSGEAGKERTMSVEEYRRYQKRIQGAVKEGKISQEDAEKRLIGMRKMVRTERKSKLEGKSELSMTLEEYRRMEKRYMAGVKAGKISQEEAEKALMEKRKYVHVEENPERTMSVEGYRRAEMKIHKAVEAGKVSKEDADMRLRRMRLLIRSEEPQDGWSPWKRYQKGSEEPQDGWSPWKRYQKKSE